MSQGAVAKKVGISDKTLRNIEKGIGPLPNDYFFPICQVLNLNPDQILLEAIIPFWLSVLEKLTQDPTGPFPALREKLLEALDQRHRAERKEADMKLLWDSVIHFRKSFVSEG